MQVKNLDYYSFFTKYSLMEEYGFSSGLINRLARKVLPQVPAENTIEYLLSKKDTRIADIISKIDWSSDSKVIEQLNLSIKALCLKVTAFGLDHNITAKYKQLNLDSAPFELLVEKINHLSSCENKEIRDLINSLNDIEVLIDNLRKNKRKIGTNLHLTLTTRRILDYTERIKELLDLKLNIDSTAHWENLLSQYSVYKNQKNSLRKYLRSHTDLLALEVVEHTSSKGEKYIAEDRTTYKSFLYRSFLGGGVIAIFAAIKLIVDGLQLSEINNAFLFSINYALCFIIVKQVGGIIATKQPAMTASTIAKNIDTQDDLQLDSINSVVLLVRKVFRSQFISIVGNFTMAILFAIFISLLAQYFDIIAFNKSIEPEYLMKSVMPNWKLVFYSTIAGIFLALSGLASGYLDNKVVASNIGYRIRKSRLFLNSNSFASYIEKKSGSLFGNIFLGFLLGSVFLLSYILPFNVDIRHIAFSSAYIGFAVTEASFSIKIIGLALAGALLIGMVNFIVSFSITLYLALKSRSVNFNLIPKILWNVLKDILRNPLSYLIAMDDTK